MEIEKDYYALTGRCSICENVSFYDEETLKASKLKINGIDIILCCPCEDELLSKLLSRRMNKKEMLGRIKNLPNDDIEDIIDLYRY